MGPPFEETPPLTEKTIIERLATRTFGRKRIEIHERIDSTNRRALDLAESGEEEGTLVLAEAQTAGRGRHGRSWHSPPGRGLWFSLVLRPDLPTERMPTITLAAGLGAARAIEEATGWAPEIKWPNDLLDGRRKIAGLLTEMEFRGGESRYAVIGLGLNVNLADEDLPPELKETAGSLYTATGRYWDRAVLLAGLLKGMEEAYGALCRGRSHEILERYRNRCATIGATVRVAQGREVIEGRAVGVDERGRLMVETTPGGETVAVGAGEVTLLKE